MRSFWQVVVLEYTSPLVQCVYYIQYSFVFGNIELTKLICLLYIRPLADITLTSLQRGH